MAATLIGFTGIGSRAQSPELFPLVSLWDSVLTARGGGGYKDNIFLSHTHQQASAFISGGGDVMLLRLAPSGPQLNFFAGGDATHYLSASPSLNEYTVFGQGQVEQSIGEALKGSIATEYFYQDQVLDVSFLDPASAATNQQTAPVRGHTFTIRPGARWDLPSQFWLALEAPMTRQYFAQPLDDYWNTGFKFTVGRRYGHDSHLSLSYEPSWRLYDTESALTATGAPIAGTHRQRTQHNAQFVWRHFWDEPKHWRTLTKLGGRLAEENGGGFADYAQYAASQQILYRARPWELSVEGRVRRYDYSTQTVSATDLAKRRRTEWTMTARLERELARHLKLITSYEHEETLSNDAAETYSVNTVSGSLQWEF